MAGARGTGKLLLKRRWFAVLLATTVLSPVGGNLSAQTVVIRGARSVTPVNFNIPSQPLASALAAFGRQSGVQVSLDAAVSEGIMSQPVVGRYSPEAALQRLLSGTGIAFRLTSDRTAVLASAPTGPVPDGTVQLDAVDIGGLGGGPIDGYVANTGTTAMKTNTPLLETPQSISVVTPHQIQQQGAQNVTQALQYTSGVINNPNASDLRWDAPLVRGFLAPVYLDGMLLPIGASQFARSRIDPFGLQEIDVLKGAAASALYGENTPGG
ncbi:MAG TPA: TonB-dependent receptor plug domain-containing protein, partial [Methylovirgula sp.]|nr:TonB-dependent receptor plug domain-containing protein [Methylovirgula sp.]